MGFGFGAYSLRGHGVGFWVPSLGLGVWGSGFRVLGVRFWVQGLGFRVQGSGFRVQDLGCRVQDLEVKVWRGACRGLALPCIRAVAPQHSPAVGR